ncbi:MAG: NAD+ synthase [Alphaproteobacteria bacterium]|nr:MAG: NAD+ synthase [Alphaproteobacteria bacterium]
MSKHFTLTLAQLNPTVGDIAGNIKKILDVYKKHKTTSDLIAFSEQIVTAYPTDDLVLKPFFIDRVMKGVEKLAKQIDGTGAGILVSAPWRDQGKVFNAALLIHDGKIVAKRFKHHLPNYGVFDEVRLFAAGDLPHPVEFKGARLGILTCEDMWFPDVTAQLRKEEAEILIVPNGSPYEVDKAHVRTDHAKKRVEETGLPLLYINQVGGQDELVFDGASFVMDQKGKIISQLPSHQEYVTTTIWEQGVDRIWVCKSCETNATLYTGSEAIYQTLMLGLRDYADKNGFPGVLLGMSGGIDSALSAAIAVDALGADRVKCFMMPSPYTSKESVDDAAECSKLLGISHGSISIEPSMKAFETMLKQAANQNVGGITAENIQARTRGMLLMAMSNATGYMVLSTGNKSEISVGYATLYGDMCGGFNVLKDVYKMTVFELSKWRNQSHPQNAKGPAGRVIPERIITKPPSAELRPGQKDEDSLPPYPVLDDILHCMVEKEMNFDEIVAKGYPAETVNKVWKLLDRAEYKRRQACPGVKISRKAFGRDRRYPITNKFTDLIVENG